MHPIKITVKGKSKSRLEYLSVREDVLKYLLDGYSRRDIYETYKEQKVFSMSYQTFCQYIRKNQTKMNIQRTNESKRNQLDTNSRVITPEEDNFSAGTYDSSMLY